MSLVRRIARPMLASTFVNGGISALQDPDRLAHRAEPVTQRIAPAVERATSLPLSLDSRQWVQLNGAVQIVGGAMLAAGKAPRLAGLVLAGSLVPTTLAGHRFWEESDPAQRRSERIQFLKNISMTGGLLLAGVDTEGKPSLAWLAKHQIQSVRKQAAKRTSGQPAKRRSKQSAKPARKPSAQRTSRQSAKLESKRVAKRTSRQPKIQPRRLKITTG